MKNLYTYFALIAFSFISSAQSPGLYTQSAPTPMFVFNNSSHVLSFEPRSHNYKEEFTPSCSTSLQYLNPFGNVSFSNPNQVGVPLSLFATGGVIANNFNVTPANVTLDVTQMVNYGKTQKWHCIKYDLGNVLGGYLIPNLGHSSSPIEQNPLIWWDVDDQLVVWDTQGTLQFGSNYSHNNNSSGGSIAWNQLPDGTVFIMAS